MIKIGLTGGIGSGKSTVAGIFKHLGVPVFNSDEEAKKLYSIDECLKSLIISNFGKDSYLESGFLNKPFMISEVFSNPEKLKRLNELVHPRVKQHFQNWLVRFNDSKLLVKEAAILFESGADKQTDKIIVVVAPLDVRIERVMKRDSVPVEKVKERMTHQWDQERLVEKANYIIDNSGLKPLLPQVLKIYYELSE